MMNRWRWGAEYVPDRRTFAATVRAGTAVPHQVELHPAPGKGRRCWLDCPHCYGRASRHSPDRAAPGVMLRALREAAAGGVGKVVFAGYCTDPLFGPEFPELLMEAIRFGLTWGINTKLFDAEPLLGVAALAADAVDRRSWVSVSVDAGSNALYAGVHGLEAGTHGYDRVLRNVAALLWRRDGAGWGRGGRPFEVGATYLLVRGNDFPEEAGAFVRDFRRAGCDVLRFAFAQPPRGGWGGALDAAERAKASVWLTDLCAGEDRPGCRVLFADSGCGGVDRTVPCVARWVFPTVGYDGWLYPCSQTAAPDFRAVALGNLAESGFWELYRAYDRLQVPLAVAAAGREMAALGCRCDRKAHAVNARAGTALAAPEPCAAGDPG